MYGPDVVILLMYGSHEVRHVGFRGLTVVNETPPVLRHHINSITIFLHFFSSYFLSFDFLSNFLGIKHSP